MDNNNNETEMTDLSGANPKTLQRSLSASQVNAAGAGGSSGNKSVTTSSGTLNDQIELDTDRNPSKKSKINPFSSPNNNNNNNHSHLSSVTWHAGTSSSHPLSLVSKRSPTSTISSSSGANKNTILPIEFRTLSIQVADTIQANNAKKLLEELKKAKEGGLLNNTTSPRTESTIANTTTPLTTPRTPDSKTPDTDYFATFKTHMLTASEMAMKFGTDTDMGLPSTEATRRLRSEGPNKLQTHRPNYLFKLLRYLFGGFCSILWVGVIVFFLCYSPLSTPPSMINFALAILVIIVILTQAGFSAFQDWSTGKVMNSIMSMLPSDCLVIRNGQTLKINSSDLVVGDLVQLHLGNKIPADMVMVTSADLKVDKAVLTGETKPIQCTTQFTDENFLESRNVVLMGTHVVNGSGTGLVVLTGNSTVMGRINKLTNESKEKVPLIQKEINRFVLIIVGLTVVLAGILALWWGVFLHRKYPNFQTTIQLIQSVMSCVVAFIPEGVPICVSLTLLMVAKRMKESSILPKALTTVETLGCVNVICSDKTGTLTQNKMTVTSLGFVDQQTSPEYAQDDVVNSQVNQHVRKAYNQIHYTAVLCNNSTWDANTINEDISVRQINGDATDSAIFRFGHKYLAISPVDLESSYPRLHDLPFNSKNKFMMTVHKVTDGSDPSFGPVDANECLMLVKGAPDVLLPRCTDVIISATGEIEPISSETLKKISAIQESWSRDGKRVILLTRRIFTPVNHPDTGAAFREESESSIQKLTIIGLLGLMDPPRPEITDTVAQCRRSGARFFMVTGDFGLTASAIARQIGIFTNKDTEPDTYANITLSLKEKSAGANDVEVQIDKVRMSSLLLTGPDLEEIRDSQDEWDLISEYDEIVFARTTPEQKLRIVKQFQKRDYTVAVTGDGVNDAPALKAADVGVAVMGCDVAIEAADLVLMESFGSITNAIRLGRLVFQNLQKVIGYLLPAGSCSEITPVIINSFLGTPLPLSSFQMIIICCFTDVFPCLSLILEREEIDLMALPPRNPKKDHLITVRIYIQAYLFMGALLTIISNGIFFSYLKEYTGLGWSDLALTFGNIDYSKLKPGITPDQFNNYYVPIGTSCTFIALVILQWGNILAIRNRRESIFRADPFRPKRRNLWIFLGMLSSLIISIIVTEVPWFQTVFLTGSVPIKYWFLPLPFAVIVLILDEIRKFCVRRNVPVITYLAW